MLEKSNYELDEEDVELQSKKFISAIVLRQKKLVAQWMAFDLIVSAVKKE